MAKRSRQHTSGCPIGYALEIFGDRWTLLILRDLLLLGKNTYKEMLAGEEGIASNILSDRLKHLESLSFINRKKDLKDGRQVFYSVTEKGASLIPVMLEIAAWGATQDKNTAAPPQFAKEFYDNREAFYADYQQKFIQSEEKQKRQLK